MIEELENENAHAFQFPLGVNQKHLLLLIDRLFSDGAAQTLTQQVSDAEFEDSIEFAFESSFEVPDIRITLCSNGTWHARQVLIIGEPGADHL